MNGNLDFTSYMTFEATISAAAGSALDLGDVKLVVPVNPALLRRGYMVGMESAGASYADLVWRWSNTTASNKLWLGRVDAGVLIVGAAVVTVVWGGSVRGARSWSLMFWWLCA